jgi:hypothetical protein
MSGFDPNLATAAVYIVVSVIYVRRLHGRWAHVTLGVAALLLAIFAVMKADHLAPTQFSPTTADLLIASAPQAGALYIA